MAGGRKPAKKKKKATAKKPRKASKLRVARRRTRPVGGRAGKPKVLKARDAVIKARNAKKNARRKAIAVMGLLQLGLMKKLSKQEKTGKRKVLDIGRVYDMKMTSDELNHLIREVNRKLRMEHKDELCDICSKNNAWRIFLRQCSHFICLPCIYSYLKTKIDENKARIACPVATCHRRIHENDVDTLLNPQLTQLDEFLGPAERKRLRDQHHLTSVRYALGPEECIVICPGCEIPYPLEPGCHYVKCASKKCKAWFCSGCGAKVDNFAHFARGGKCDIGSTDIYRIAYLLRMLLTMSIFGLILLLPAFIYAMHFIFPFVVGFGIASAIVSSARKCFDNVFLKIVLVIIAILPASIIGLICTILTVPVGFLFSVLYLQLMALRWIPASIMNRIALWTIRKILKLMGFAAVDLASNEGERAKLMVEVDEWQVAQEASEKVEADDLNQLEAKLERILQEDRARHKALAEGEDA